MGLVKYDLFDESLKSGLFVGFGGRVNLEGVLP